MNEFANGELPSPEKTPGIEEIDLVENELKIKRAAYAANYYEQCMQFMSQPCLPHLQAVDRALNKVSVEDIDASEAEKLVIALRPLLMFPQNNVETVLLACQLVVRFQVAKPESHWMASIDVTERAASSFRDVSLYLLGKRENMAEFKKVIDAWTQLVCRGQLEEHHRYPLMTSALQWIFTSSCDAQIRRSFVQFMASAYSRLPNGARDQIIHDILSVWMREGTSSSSMRDLVLSIVAVSGSVSHDIWEGAVTIKSRSIIETEAHNAHSTAVSVANLVSRRLIDFTWSSAKSSTQRMAFQQFLSDCADALVSPNWPAAELFVSSFISSLFQLSNATRSQRYAAFMFDCIRQFSTNLAKISSASGSGSSTAMKVIMFSGETQAYYIASRQCSQPNQPFFDIFDALSKRQLAQRSLQLNKPSFEEGAWLQWLAQFPIASYHAKLCAMACDLATREDLKDQTQIDLFRLLENYLERDPSLFKMAWLDRLSYAMPAVCEALIPLVTIVYERTENLAAVQRAAARIGAPGAPQYKRRMLALLDSAVTNNSNFGDLLNLAWRVCLMAITDIDTAVKTTAMSYATTWFKSHDVEAMCQAFVAAQSHVDKSLVQRGLLVFISAFRNSSKTDDLRIRNLVKQLLSSQKYELALIFVKADGGFTPVSQISSMMRSICAPQPLDTQRTTDDTECQLCLKIIEYTLRARPRVVLPPSLATSMFTSFIQKLKTASSIQLESLGSILGQLVSLGSPQVQQQRLDALHRIAQSARSFAAKTITQTSQDPRASLVLRQSLTIAGCMRFWQVPKEESLNFVHQMLDWTMLELELPLRLVIIHTVFNITKESSDLLSDPRVDQFLTSFGPGTAESKAFTSLLLKWLRDNNYRSENAEQQQNRSHLHEIGIDQFSSTHLQKHLSRLVDLARKEEDVVILKVLAKGIEDNLLIAEECVPVITSLSFSSKPDVSQTALRSFVTLCERWPRNIGVKFVEGLELVGQNGLAATKCGLPYSPLRIMWKVLKSNMKGRNLKPTLAQLARLFRLSINFELLNLLISGLTEVEMEPRDAKYLCTLLEDGVNQFHPKQHSREETTKTIIIFVFALWLRRRYGLSEQYRLASKETDEDVEPMNCHAIWLRFTQDDKNAAESLDQLWRLPDWYGTPKMMALVYGSTLKREADADLRFTIKKAKSEETLLS